MIDNFSLLVSHGLLALLCWRLLSRPDLDGEPPASAAPPAVPEPAEAPRPDWRRSPRSARIGPEPRGDA